MSSRGHKTRELWTNPEYRKHMTSVQRKYDIDINLLKQEYLEQNFSCIDLSKKYGCSVWTIVNRLKKAGVNEFRRGTQIGHVGCKSFLGKKHTPEVREKIRQSKIGEKNPNWSGGKSVFVCELCGNEFQTRLCARETAKFCSNKCAHEAMGPWNKGIYGKDSHMWKDNKKSPLKTFLRHISDYNEWRKAVFERDDYTCQICHKRGGYLHAHHIKYFSEIIDEYEIDSYEKALECPLLWDIDNGTTLCINCHRKIHFISGTEDKDE